jgi:hypothetical protein
MNAIMRPENERNISLRYQGQAGLLGHSLKNFDSHYLNNFWYLFGNLDRLGALF